MRIRVALSALVLASAPLAHADTFDFFVHECLYGECDNPAVAQTNLEFQINNAVAPDSSDATTFTYDNVVILQAGTSAGDGPNVTFDKYGFFLSGPNGENLSDGYNDDSFSIDEYVDPIFHTYYFPLFEGSTSNPTFLTGSADINTSHSYYAYGNAFGGILTVTDLDAVPTPEPSSLALLGTGLLGAVGAVRKRFAS